MSKKTLGKSLCFLCFALCAAVIAVLICGCGDDSGNSEIIGTWVPTTVNTNGEDIPYSELETDGGDFGIVFTDSKNCTVTLAGISIDTTYTFNGTSVDMTVNGTDYKLSYDSGVLTMELDYDSDAMVLTFTKQRDSSYAA